MVDGDATMYFNKLLICLTLFSLLRVFLGLSCFVCILVCNILCTIRCGRACTTEMCLSGILFITSNATTALMATMYGVILVLNFNFSIGTVCVSSVVNVLIRVLVVRVGINIFERFGVGILSGTLVGGVLEFSIPLYITAISC